MVICRMGPPSDVNVAFLTPFEIIPIVPDPATAPDPAYRRPTQKIPCRRQ